MLPCANVLDRADIESGKNILRLKLTRRVAPNWKKDDKKDKTMENLGKLKEKQLKDAFTIKAIKRYDEKTATSAEGAEGGEPASGVGENTTGAMAEERAGEGGRGEGAEDVEADGAGNVEDKVGVDGGKTSDETAGETAGETAAKGAGESGGAEAEVSAHRLGPAFSHAVCFLTYDDHVRLICLPGCIWLTGCGWPQIQMLGGES